MNDPIDAIVVITVVPLSIILIVSFCLKRVFGDMSVQQARHDFDNMRTGDGMHHRIVALILWLFAFVAVFAIAGALIK